MLERFERQADLVPLELLQELNVIVIGAGGRAALEARFGDDVLCWR